MTTRFAIFDKDTKSYYRGGETPGKRSKATVFNDLSRARAEVTAIRTLGLWPLHAWSVVKIST